MTNLRKVDRQPSDSAGKIPFYRDAAPDSRDDPATRCRSMTVFNFRSTIAGGIFVDGERQSGRRTDAETFSAGNQDVLV